MRAFEMKFEMLCKVEGWTPPTIRFGMFVKGESDSWVVKSRGF